MKPKSLFLLQKSIEFILSNNYDSAEIYLNQLLKIDSKNSEAYRYLGIISAFKRDYSSSLNHLNKALKISPKSYFVLTNIGSVLTKQRKFKEALDCFEKALNINSKYHEALSNKGLLNFERRNYKEALSDYNSAIKQEQNFMPAWLNKANVLVVLKRPQEAEEIYQSLINKFPTYFDARYNYSLFLLNEKKLSIGWIEYENRWLSSEFNCNFLGSNIKLWDGKGDTNGLLIWPEQGVGDQILYGSMLSNLENSSITVTVALEKKLLPIFSRSFPKINFIDKEKIFTKTDIKYEKQIPIASLGKIFRNSIDSFPSTKKYLIDGVAKTKKIKNQLNKSKKLKCGISWKSSNPYVGDEKSIPLEIFLSIFDGVEIELINLQHDINDDEKEFFRKKNVSLIVLNVDLYNDLDETLSLIEACDLVISSSNTIAHMAGSIGKLGAVIIPFASGRFWYWHEIKNTSLWYPSISVFKQNDQGDWSFPIQRANEFLRANFE